MNGFSEWISGGERVGGERFGGGGWILHGFRRGNGKGRGEREMVMSEEINEKGFFWAIFGNVD